MGRIASILSFIRRTKRNTNLSDIKADPGDGAIITGEVFQPSGDDAHPLDGDQVITVLIPRSGGEVIVGYVDPKNDQKTLKGEKRIYARDGQGNSIVEFWLKSDGSATLSNANGSVALSINGDIIASNTGASHKVNVDGTVKSDNGSGFIELKTDGSVDINGFIIDSNGNALTSGTIKGAGVTDSTNNITLNSHHHGGPPPTTGS